MYSLEYFYRAIQKYGWDNFEHIIFAEDLTKQDADHMEILLIKFYNTTDRDYGYNICYGGGGSYGRIISEETRKKMSESAKARCTEEWVRQHVKTFRALWQDEAYRQYMINRTYLSGEQHPSFGKPLSDEVKQKISIANTGKPAWNKGIPASEESKRKNRESHIGLQGGENNPMYGKNHTEETKAIIGNKAKERLSNPQNNPMFGKHHTEETKKKISEKAQNRTEEHRQKLSVALKSRFADKNHLPDYLKCQSVVQLTRNGEYIAKYPSIAEAGRQTQIQPGHISACCKHKDGHHTAGGFCWLYLIEWEETQGAI